MYEDIPTHIKDRFGQVLFGSARGEYEKDTAYEIEIYRKVYSYFSGAGMLHDSKMDKIEKAFNELLSVKDYYPDVLSPVSDLRGFIFRGVPLDNKVIIDKFQKTGLLNPLNYEVISGNRAVARNITYVPRHYIESWTIDPSFAKKMGSQGSENDDYILFETKSYNSKNFLFSIEFTNLINVTLLGKIEEEYEILRLSNSPLKVNAVINIPREGSYMDKIMNWSKVR